MEHEQSFLHLKNLLEADEILKQQNKPGWCRFWTNRALNILDKLEGVNAEARETKDGNHTFVQVTIGDETYILDGVGYKRSGPYFGPDTNAPQHLKDNEVDMITSYRSLLKKGNK
jgi:hypothetical protein